MKLEEQVELIAKSVFTPIFLTLFGFATLGNGICYMFFAFALVSVLVSVGAMCWLVAEKRKESEGKE